MLRIYRQKLYVKIKIRSELSKYILYTVTTVMYQEYYRAQKLVLFIVYLNNSCDEL